jgi:hypothetical protein
MRYTIAVFAVVLLLGAKPVSAARLAVERGSDLQAIIDYASNGDTILIGAKTLEARPTRFIDSLCGNCEDSRTPVNATYGFLVKGKGLVFVGAGRQETELRTNAGYGIFFVDSHGSVLENLTVTGGRRDPDGRATDAGIVVRRSTVLIQNVDVRDNEHRIDSVVVGICGIVGREGAEINILNCNIVNNGWDGMALYRGASANISDCVIKDGRGAGIGVTWDATCVAYRNKISGYWKGIGSFGTSILVARNNLVRDCLGWGIIATGESCLDAANNVVYHNGNCGVAPWSTTARGRIINNIIAGNGWRDQWVCPCVGVWNYGDWAKWDFSHNIVWNNKAGEYQDIWDQTGINGNLSIDPMFVGDGDFSLQQGSPALHAGDSLIFNTDGTTSHIGLTGGPQATVR